MNREHGIDFSIYRIGTLPKPENPPLPMDFAIIMAVYGTTELANWKANCEYLKTFPIRGVDGAFRAYVTPEAAAKALVDRALQAGAHFCALDFEKYIVGYKEDKTPIYREVTAADVAYLVRWYDEVERLGKHVVVYGSQSKMYLIKQANPAFYARMKKWVAFDKKPVTIDSFSSAYIPLLGDLTEEALIAQYDAHLDGASYGINYTLDTDRSKDSGKPAKFLDGDVWVNKNMTMREWLGIDEPEEPEEPGDPGTPPVEGNFTMKDFLIKLALWILKLYDYDPCEGVPPVEPPPVEPPPTTVEDTWPSYVKNLLGKWDAWKDKVSLYSPNDLLAIYEVTDNVGYVWSPSMSFDVQRPDGSNAKKYVFDIHEMKNGTFWNIPKGEKVICFKKVIPASTATYSLAYANGEPHVEIVVPAGLAIQAGQVKRLGYFDSIGNYTEG